MLPQNLGAVEVRVLGSLIEKALSTPDHYPLSLNALVAACNQSSNRDPVMALDDTAVSDAVTLLRRQNLVRSFQGSGERVPKYQHLLADVVDLTPAELAVLCVLTLRGPQTLNEVRTRSARLTPHDDHAAVDAALEALIAREPTPAAVRLPRRPGQKEQRYAHLLGGDVTYEETEQDTAPMPTPTADRVAAVEALVQELRSEIADVRAEFAEFRRQFE